MATEAQRERAIRLAEKLIELVPDTDETLLRRAVQMRDRLKTPMKMVLDRVPGDTVVEKSKRIGVTRQTYYDWLKGAYRPNIKQAKRLAQLTGVGAEEIRGRSVDA